MKSFTIKRIRHCRILELRNMALRGAKLEDLKEKCVQWNVAKATQESYIDEVRESLEKLIAKQNKQEAFS